MAYTQHIEDCKLQTRRMRLSIEASERRLLRTRAALEKSGCLLLEHKAMPAEHPVRD